MSSQFDLSKRPSPTISPALSARPESSRAAVHTRASVATRAAALAACCLVAAVLVSQPAAAQKRLTTAEKAAAMSVVARQRAEAGQFKIAAEMYKAAYRLDGQVVGYLYSAARCAQSAGNVSGAAADYERFLAAAPVDHALAQKARGHLATCKAKVAAESAREAAERKAVADKAQAAREAAARDAAARAESAHAAAAKAGKPAAQVASGGGWRAPTAWASVAVGVASVATGAWFLADGSGKVDDLKLRLDDTNSNYKIKGIDRDAALAMQDEANQSKRIGAAAAGVGVVLAGVGVWMLLSDAPSTAAVTRLPGGAAFDLAWRF